MKRNKRILLYFILSVMFQVTLFALLNRQAGQLLNPYFRLDQAYVVPVEATQAGGFSLSYNNKYLGYITAGNELDIIDLTANKLIAYDQGSNSKAEVLAFSWLPDRNSLVYLAADEARQKETLLFSLDLDSIQAVDSGQGFAARLERTLNIPMPEVLAVGTSTYTSNLYILYEELSQHSQLVKLDIMKNVNQLGDPAEDIRSFCVSNKFGTVYYESGEGVSKKIVAARDSEETVITRDKNSVLLGCLNNTVYIGQLDERKELETIELYQEGATNNQEQFTRLWQGELPFDSPEVQIAANGGILIKETAYLTRIQPDGKLLKKKLPAGRTVVLSPAGTRYLDLVTQKDKLVYYWREI